MKDSVVRGQVLQLLFERRADGPLPFGAAQGAIPPPAGIDERDWLHALAQLAEYDLIDWRPVKDPSLMGRMGGLAMISETGLAVLDGREYPQIDIRLSPGARTRPGRTKAPLTQPAVTREQQTLANAFEKVLTALDKTDVGEKDKSEARSLLRRFLESKAAAAALGANAQLLLTKYFAS